MSEICRDVARRHREAGPLKTTVGLMGYPLLALSSAGPILGWPILFLGVLPSFWLILVPWEEPVSRPNESPEGQD